MVSFTERFYSTQCEGARIRPAVFVRTALCNFTCKGFGCTLKAPDGSIVEGCDSIRAVSPKFKDNWSSFVNFEDAVEWIDEVVPTFSKHNIMKPDFVFTGGEPFIHWKDETYQRILSHYSSRGHQITIETNGSLDVELNRKYHRDIIFSISCKLSNSGEPEHKRINIKNLTNLLENGHPDSYLKFVVSKDTWEQDWPEIKSILKSLPLYANVYLMPMGDVKEKIDYNCQFVMERCTELGFCYSDRLHIRAWNDREAV
jgi:organic radical activating enzyme